MPRNLGWNVARLLGEPGGTRTHDPLIKSQVLYRLSYGLRAACVGAGLRTVNSGTGGFPAGIPQVPVTRPTARRPQGSRSRCSVPARSRRKYNIDGANDRD